MQRGGPLQSAFLISGTVHLVALLVLPGPRAQTPERDSIQLAVVWQAPAPTTLDDGAVEATLSAELGADLSAADRPDEPDAVAESAADEPSDEPVVDEPAAEETPAEETALETHSPPPTPVEPAAASPEETESDETASEASTDTEDVLAGFDPDKLQQVLEETARMVEAERKQADVRRYRFHVRERLRNALVDNYPNIVVTAKGKGSEERAIVQFRIEEEGYLYRLSLRAAPGSQLPSVKLQRLIESLSPFDAPPANATSKQLHFYFELVF